MHQSTAELARLSDADEAAVAALARHLAAAARPGDTLLLDGPLGAGKTHFARAFIRAALGSPAEDVPSPSFTLVQTYAPEGRPDGPALWHVDLYRLDGAGELAELGLEDAAEGDIRLIEWPDRMASLPPGALRVTLAPGGTADRRKVILSGDPALHTDLPRLVERVGFVLAADWAEAVPTPLAGDASSRRYFRLIEGERTAVLMDDPSGPTDQTGRIIRLTAWLRQRGFHAPEVLTADAPAGLLLLEDLGDDLVARVIDADPALTEAAYFALTDTLVDLHAHRPPPGLLALNGPELAAQAGLFAAWYGRAAGVPSEAGGAIAAAITALHRDLCEDAAPVFGLRDCHAENLVWMGAGRPLGLLDFQDAVSVHPAYDLVSALQDARRDVPREVEAAAIARYVAATGVDADRFGAAYALLGAQRNLRILGIFARLCLHFGKPRYLAFMPRAWAHVTRNLAHPALAPLAEALRPFPPPDAALIDRMAAQCGTHPTA